LQFFNFNFYFFVSCLFSLTFTANAQECVNGQTFTLSSAGPYQPGDVVEVTYTLDAFDQININWIIAFEINIGEGWSNLTPILFPENPNPNNNLGTGYWIWDNQNTFPSDLNFGPGFRFINDGAEYEWDYGWYQTSNGWNFGWHQELVAGDPNWGSSSTGPFIMSFQITVSETCSADDLSIGIEVFGDCLTGSWNNGNCCNDPEFLIYNGVVDVQINPPFAGTSNSINLCSGSDPINLFDQLGGSPDLGGNWSPALTNGYLGTFDPQNNSNQAYSYTVSNECGMSSATVNINFIEPIISNTTEVEICSENVAIDLYGEIGINNTSGQWSGVGPLLDSPSPDYFGLFDPEEQIEGIYNYSIFDNSGCETIYPVNVDIINSQANAGNDATVLICQDDEIFNLFDVISGNPDINGNWNPSLNGSYLGQFDPSSNFSGTYTYTIIDECGSDNSEVNVIINVVNPPPILTD
jgi:hypothetical protein